MQREPVAGKREQDIVLAAHVARRGAFEQGGITVGTPGMQCEQRRGRDLDGSNHYRRVRHESPLLCADLVQASIGPRDRLQSMARKIRLPFVPPKPKEFDNATRIGICRAVCGT